MERKCAVCGAVMTPMHPQFMVAHEYKCYVARPDLVPPEHKAQFDAQVLGDKRSAAAKRGVETRRRLGGKRAPR